MPSTTKKNPNSGAKCPKIKSDGTRCGQPAGARTEHPGYGLCFYHGGNKKVYDTSNPTLQSKIEEYKSDPDLFNMVHEIATLKALAYDVLQSLEQNRGNLAMVASVRDVIETLGKTQERAIKILAQKQYYLTVAQVDQKVQEIGTIVHGALEERYGADEAYRVLSDIAVRISEQLELPAPPDTLEEMY